MELIQAKYGTFELVPGDRIVSESMRWYGEWAENELDILRRFIGDGDVVADIGSFIGTHAIAFARHVGRAGKVLAFEPRPEIFAVLDRNVERNGLTNVRRFNAGISDKAGVLTIAPLSVGDHVNPGGLSLTAASAGVSAELMTIDGLALDRLDLMKIDVEGMEAEVLQGAQATITTLRPVVFAECNTMEGASAVLAAFAHGGYTALGATYPAFNKRNYRENESNIFGDSRECALIFVPDEKLGDIPRSDMRVIDTLDDVVGLLMSKPQYLPEILPHLAGEAPVREGQNLPSESDPAPALPLHVIVPFYRNEELVTAIGESLLEVREELAALGAKLYLYNDSPDYAPLGEALSQLKARWNADDLTIVTNDANLGFVGTCNLAFKTAIDERADVILLNSDAIVFPGALREMVSVAALDAMIGFVSPRSNNATIASLPQSSVGRDRDPDAAYADFVALSGRLRRYTFAPTAIGFALWIRGSIIAEMGGFDTVYGRGYNEENDLIMRGSRCGYRAVLANHAFVWHKGEVSLGPTADNRTDAEVTNGAVLRERYPEYDRMLSRYFASAGFRAEALLDELHRPDIGSLVAFDYSNFGPYHNGTFEAGLKLLDAATRLWPASLRLGVMMTPEAWTFHRLDRFARVERIDPDGDTRCAAVFRMGQPFQFQELSRLYLRSAVVGIFMLDTISADCGYLSLDFDEAVWRTVFDESDVVFTNSIYTRDRILRRFRIGADVDFRISRHSLLPSDFAPPLLPGQGKSEHVFVVGNHFAHKFVEPTVDAIAEALPDLPIVAVGYPTNRQPPGSVKAYAAGRIDDATFERFYADASAIVFPSHYEGFGFPMFHALAREKIVFARDTKLNRELAQRVAAGKNIHLYETTTDLIERLKNIPAWNAEEQAVDVHDWQVSAMEIWHGLEAAMRRTSAARIEGRIERIRLITSNGVPAPAGGVGFHIALRIAPLIERLLRVPGVLRTLKVARSVRRGLRNKLR